MRFLPASDQALLVELDDLPQTMALYRACVAQPLPGVQSLVPAARTLLVQFAPWATTVQQVQQAVQARARTAWQRMESAQLAAANRVVEIPVHYGGEDLQDVAQLLGLSVQEVVRQHTAQPYDAAFAGFAPGFVYLSGGANFQVPRRHSPRTKVPAGAVALGGNFSAVYPSASPGGWQLIGVTPLAMWDLARAEPAYVQPGFQVQFVDADRCTVAVPAGASTPAEPPHANMADCTAAGGQGVHLNTQPTVTCISTGLHTAFQDHGRYGMEGLGISASGALDQGAMRRANRMVGNPIHTPVLENLLGQLVLRAQGPCTLAVSGAAVTLQVRSRAGQAWLVPQAQAVALNAGDSLHVGTPMAGVRCYVAVRGGFAVQPVLGSCSTDSLAQVGPAPLQAGQVLEVGCSVPPSQLQAVPLEADAAPELPRAGDTVWLDVVLGPRTDWLTPQALQTLTEQPWAVTPQSNRIGMRLQGAQPLERLHTQELPSEGTVPGAIQVPLSGQPVLFLADHPLTGGYPVMGALASHHMDLAAQIPVGCHIRFRVVAPFAAQAVANWVNEPPAKEC